MRFDIGAEGEDLAVGFLERSGHTILSRRWRYRHLEVDIVTRKDKVLHFVEVKSSYGREVILSDRVRRDKISNLIKAAAAYLRVHPADDEVVFDVIAVSFIGGSAKIDYIESAFLPVF